jgi:hypothetical protein
VPLIQWIQNTWVDQAIRGSVATIRIAEIVHLFCLALFGGSVFLLNLILFARDRVRRSASRIADELLPWTATGLTGMALSGLVLFLSSPEKFYPNPALRMKFAFLLPAVLFQFTIHRRIALANPPASSSKARLAACFSTLLWVAVGFAGKAIGPFAVE